MAKTLRFRKNGKRVYQITCPRGYDPITKKKLSPYSMTWEVPENWSDKKAEKEAARIEADFLAKGAKGELQTKQEQKEQEKQSAIKAEKEKLEYSKSPTFKEYTEIYFRNRSVEVKHGTVLNNRNCIRRFSEIFDNFKLQDITTRMCKKFWDDQFCNSGLSYDSNNNAFIAVCQIFNMAAEDGYIEVSPMSGLKKPKRAKENQKKDLAFTIEELSYILKCADKEPLKNRLFIYLLSDTGMRRGEALGLKWENLNTETGECLICNNIQYSPKKGIYETTPKNGNNRTIFINKELLPMIKEWKEVQKLETVFKYGYTTQPIYCFEDQLNKPMNPIGISNYFNRFGKKYGITDFHAHKLRHTMATIMIANGIDDKTVSLKLGHSSVSFTLNKYTHPNETAQRRANELFANMVYSSLLQGESC